jgi:WD40 repeat protein
MPKISISYRRADSEAMTGRIFDRLSMHYGKDAIFRDIDNIPPGIDFRVHINETLRKTHVLLAIIGPNWVGASGGDAGRIQQESDAVRVEIETALRRRLPLIPVLIGNTVMPGSEQLPPSLKDFAFRNAVRVDTGQDFDYHMERLIRSVDAMLSQAQKSPPSGETKIGADSSKPDTGSRQAISGVSDPQRKTTGSRAAVVGSAATGQTSKERAAISRISPELLWPADRQGQMLRLGIAGAAALVLILAVYGIFLRGSGGNEDRLLTLTGHTGPVSTVAFSPNSGLIAAGSSDKSILIWDSGSGLLRQTLAGQFDAVYAIAFEPNGKRIVSGGKDGVIAIRDTDTGQRMVRALRPEMTYGWDVLPSVLSLAVSPDSSTIVSGNADATAKLWSDSTGALLHTLNGHGDAVTSVAYTPDGRTIVSGSADGTVRTWDAVSGNPLRTLKSSSGQILSVAISPDGKRIAAAGSGDAVVIWDATNLQQLQKLSTQLSAVNALAFSRDGRQLAVGGSDTSIQIWNADAGQLLHSLAGHSESVRALAYSPDGRRLASGSDDRTVGIWPAN